ncbi:MAG TPA: ribonuclease H-like domain-containing protein [Chloroflexota bacterium]
MARGIEIVGPLYLDVETQRTFDEVRGRGRLSALGLALAVTYDAGTGAFATYTEDRVEELVASLQAASLVVGFNILGFDYPVLQAYTSVPLRTLPTLDLLEAVRAKLGFRVSLDNLARGTLGVGKTGDGLQAVAWFRQGRLAEVAEYCRADVDLLRQLCEHAVLHGCLYYVDCRGHLRRILLSLPSQLMPQTLLR